MNGLEARELRYFVAVAEELHFGRAAADPVVGGLSPSRLYVAWAERTRSRAVAAFVRASCEVGDAHAARA